LPEFDEELTEDVFAEECGYIRDIIGHLPRLVLADEPTKPFGILETNTKTLDFESLVRIRVSHQTSQARRGVRTRHHPTGPDNSEVSVRRQLIRRFHEVLKEQQDQGAGTGCERAAR